MKLVNASFETAGALFAWHNFWLALHTPPAGVSWMSFAFSAVWGLACIPYYSSVDDGLSAAVAGVRSAGNVAWCIAALGSGST